MCVWQRILDFRTPEMKSLVPKLTLTAGQNNQEGRKQQATVWHQVKSLNCAICSHRCCYGVPIFTIQSNQLLSSSIVLQAAGTTGSHVQVFFLSHGQIKSN